MTKLGWVDGEFYDCENQSIVMMMIRAKEEDLKNGFFLR